MNAEHETVVLEGMDSSMMVFDMFITYVTYCFYVERTTLIQSNRSSKTRDQRRQQTQCTGCSKHGIVWVVYQGEGKEFVRVEYFMWLGLRRCVFVT